MDFVQDTRTYYACRLGEEDAFLFDAGVRLIRSDTRDRAQPGYSDPFALWVWAEPGRLLVSYGARAASRMERLQTLLEPDLPAVELKARIQAVFYGKVLCQFKYYLFDIPQMPPDAVVLQRTQYPDYRALFLSCHPGCGSAGWLEDYFYDMVDSGFCCGVFAEGKLVSCTDLPDMPYLPDRFAEIGVNTHPQYRGRGYAAQACALSIRRILEAGKCPLYSAFSDNIASQRVAERTGFQKLGEVFALHL